MWSNGRPNSLLLYFVPILLMGHVVNVMAAGQPEIVVLSCLENNPGSGYSVINYDSGSDAPAQSSSNCATELDALLNAGLDKMSANIQTYTNSGGSGAPGGVDGTYITYELSIGTSAMKTQQYGWLPAVLQLLL